jgi:beta-glucosidase
MASSLVIPDGFQMGVATSSWQIEGDSAGRGRCVWDDFAMRPGAIVDGTRADPACDHVARYVEDLDLLSWFGVDTYRFSISWPRVKPGGSGPLAATGLDFYDRLIDGLLERGIEPVATLYHWDLPSELQATGGWVKRDTADRFADYAEAMGARYADRVARWATLNEPWCSSFLSYAAGVHAPGMRDPGASLAAAYHLMLGHGLAMQRLRAVNARNLGIVLNITPVYATEPSMEAVAHHVDGTQNRFFLDLLAGRGVPQDLIENCAHLTDWSFVQDSDNSIISTQMDWIGENYYSVMRVAPPDADTAAAVGQDALASPGCPPMTYAPRAPLTQMGWEIYPPGMTEVLHRIAKDLPGIPMWICENGGAMDETVDDSGVHDPIRTNYLQAHISAVLQARNEGVDVRGYFAWSLLDNIEWAEGWTKRFGLVRVDVDTQVRTPKDSALWYRSVLQARGAPD